MAFFAVFFLLPLFLAIEAGFQNNGEFSFYWLKAVLTNPVLMKQLLNSLMVALVTTAIVIFIAVPLSLVNVYCRYKGQSLFGALILLPMVLPPFVGGLAIRRFLGQFGILNLILQKLGLLELFGTTPPDWLGSGLTGLVLLQSLHLFPIMYLSLSATLANLNPAYAQAAKNLGAGALRTFFNITLPLMRPGLFAGGSLVFIWSFTDIGTPLMVKYEALAPVTIFKELAQADVSPKTYSLVFIVLLLSVIFYLLGKFFFGRPIAADSVKASYTIETRQLKKTGTVLAWLLFGCVTFLAVLPHIGVIVTAFSDNWLNTILPTSYTLKHFQYALTKPQTSHCIINSLQYAGVATVINILVGCTAAWLIVRFKPWGSKLLDSLVMMPLAVPGLILASGYIAMTAPGSILENIGPMHNPFIIMAIAYSIRRAPFVVRSVASGLEQIPVAMEEAACNLGAAPRQAIFRITLPLIVANIIAAAGLTFSFNMLEVSDSLVLAQLQPHYPITKEIYRQATQGNVDAPNIAAALGVLGMLLLGGSLAAAAALLGKKLGAIFRA